MIAVLAFVLAMAPPAASKCVVFVGDSITAPHATLYPSATEWPKLLQRIRPDITPCNVSVGGRNVPQALAAFDATMAWLTRYHQVTDVVVLLGLNNVILQPAPSPEQTAQQLRQLAAKIRTWGAREHILAPTPALVLYGNPYVRDISRWLDMLNGIGPSYEVQPLRDKFTELYWGSCSSDGIHPTGQPCRQAIASFVAGILPRQ